MKKLAVLLLTAAMSAALLCGCGGSEKKTSEPAAQTQTTATAAASDYTFTLKGTQIAMNQKMDEITTALGKEDKYFESESCAFQGMDKVYTYGSVVINTYPLSDVDYVFSIELKDDTVETPEGIAIGSSKDDVVKAYGEAAEATDTALTYASSNCKLCFIMKDGNVTNITYTAITE